MPARLPITVYARQGEGQASVDILIKSEEDTSTFNLAIESGSNRSTFNFRFRDGKAELDIDTGAIQAIAEKIVLETARLVIEAGILAVHGNELEIKADSMISLLSQIAMRIGAPDLQIGSGALSITAAQSAKLVSPSLLAILARSLIVQSPKISLQGQVNLGSGNMRPIARMGDKVQISGVQSGSGTAIGTIITGGGNLSS